MTITENLMYSRTPPLSRTLVIRFTSHPDRLGLSGKFVESSTKIQSDTKKRELLKNPTKIEEIKEKKY